MPTQYIAKSQAYATAVLHALQHPSQTVLGVLAGKDPHWDLIRIRIVDADLLR